MEQEETGIFKEVVTGLRILVSERFITPLMPSFMISWVGVNYRFFLAIFSDESLDSKLSFIDEKLYPNWTFIAGNGFLLPLVFALFYIYLYPLLAKPVYRYSLKSKQDLNDLRQDIEKEQRYSLAQTQKFRAYYHDRYVALQNQIQELEEEIEQHKAKITELVTPLNRLDLPPVTTGAEPDFDRVPQPSGPLFSNTLSYDELAVLKALSDAEEHEQDYLLAAEIKAHASIGMTDLKIALEELLRSNLISASNSSDGKYYALTHEGRKILKESEIP